MLPLKYILKLPIYLFNYYPSFLSKGTHFYSVNYTDNGGRPEKEGVIFMCDGKLQHGGLTDRLRGLLTTFENVQNRGLPFFINWNSPFKLENYLQPNEIDWRISPEQISYNKRYAFPVILWECVADKHRALANKLQLSLALVNRKKQVHVYSNSNNSKGQYATLYSKLFKPSPLLENEINNHLNKLGSHYWSFSFRFQQLLGDFKDICGVTLSPSEQESLINHVKSEVEQVIKELPANYRVLVASDSMRFIDAIKELDSRIYSVEGRISHVDIDANADVNSDIWLKTFLDNQLIMNAEKVFLFKTGQMYNSGFPRFAAEVGGKPFILHEF